MADLKISQFIDGGAIEPTDEIATNRGGDNTKVFVGTAAALDAGDAIGDVLEIIDIGGNPGLPPLDGSQLTNVSSVVDIADVTGLGAGVENFLITPSSSNLAAAVTGETGSGALVFGTAPTLDNPNVNKISNLTTNGFVKTSSANGTLIIDTNTYLTSSGAVTSLAGTSNQVIASASTGAVTLSLPQNIHTAATPQFGYLGVGQAADTTKRLVVKDNGQSGLYVAEIHADDGTPYVLGIYNDTYSSINAVFAYFAYDTGEFRMGTQNATAMSLFTNGYSSPRMTISSGGLVGVNQTVPTAYLDVPAGTTAAASIRLRSGAGPTTPNDGDIWRADNTNTGLKVRIAGVTKTITVT